MMPQGVPVIRSIDDLMDGRAKSAAKGYSIGVENIYPNFKKCVESTMAGFDPLEHPENAATLEIESYRFETACALIISYELTQREVFMLPMGEEKVPSVEKDGMAVMNTVNFGLVNRAGPVAQQKIIAGLLEVRLSVFNSILQERQATTSSQYLM